MHSTLLSRQLQQMGEVQNDGTAAFLFFAVQLDGQSDKLKSNISFTVANYDW